MRLRLPKPPLDSPAAPKQKTPMSTPSHPLAWIASPLAAAYGGAVRLRRALYDQGRLSQAAAPLFTLSIGGLEAGGSGKTPVTGWWLAELLALGLKPGLLTRGYGRPTRALRVRRSGEPADPRDLGDEPAMLVQSGLDVAVAACPSRRTGAAALQQVGCQVLVLDDGFAHRALRRDLDVVVLRAESPLGNGHLLPWGTLREPPSSLRRAHVVWLHAKSERRVEVPEALRAHAPQALWVQSRAQTLPPVNGWGQPVDLRDAPVVVAAGIAWPRQFKQSVSAAGGNVRALVRYRDHHAFTLQDVARLRLAQHKHGAAALVVTPKDAIKLAPLWPDLGSLWVLGTSVNVECGKDALLARLKTLIPR